MIDAPNSAVWGQSPKSPNLFARDAMPLIGLSISRYKGKAAGAIGSASQKERTKPQMNTAQPRRNQKNPPRRREEREVFEIAFLRALRVFAVKISLTAGQGFGR